MLDRSSEREENMDTAAIIQEIAPLEEGFRSVKDRIRTAACRLGWPYGRVRHAWYGAVRLSLAEGMHAIAVRDDVREARKGREREEQRRRDEERARQARDLEAARHELERGLQIVLNAAAAFAAADPEGVGSRLDALKRVAGESGFADLARGAGKD